MRTFRNMEKEIPVLLRREKEEVSLNFPCDQPCICPHCSFERAYEYEFKEKVFFFFFAFSYLCGTVIRYNSGAPASVDHHTRCPFLDFW